MAALAMCFLLSCAEKKQEEATLSGLKKADFVSEVQGKPTALYVLKNKQGAEACVTNWGGRLVSVMVPDKNGKLTDVVLGYDNIQQYVANPNNNYGGLIGRYALKLNYYTLIGVLSGATTNPPALAYSNDQTSCDAPSVGYATVYPLTMFLRVLTAQLLILSLA